MSRDFEELYKEEIMNELPDLWSEIENRLPEKQITTSTKADQEVNQEMTNQNKRIQNKRIQNKRRYRTFVSVAAACVVVIIGVMSFSRHGAKNQSDTAMDMNATSNSQMSDMAESAAYESESDYDETDGYSVDSTNNMQESMADASAGESKTMNEDMAEDSVAEGTNQSTQESNAVRSDNALLFDFTILVQSIENTGEETVCVSTISQSATNSELVGNEIRICLTDEQIANFAVGNMYHVKVQQADLAASNVDTFLLVEIVE